MNNNGEEYCTCPNGYNLTMKNNITGICESKYILIYNLAMTDKVHFKVIWFMESPLAVS